MTRHLTPLMLALSVVTASASAQTTGNPPPPPTVQATIVESTMSDNDFILKAAEGGLMGLAAGKLGVQKATHADVKAYAERIATDYNKVNAELTALAQTKGVVLTKAEEASAAQTSSAAPPTALNTLTGPAFDRAYMDQMVKDQEATVLLFEAQASDGKDAEVKAWAAKILPALKAHLKDAQGLQARIGG